MNAKRTGLGIFGSTLLALMACSAAGHAADLRDFGDRGPPIDTFGAARYGEMFRRERPDPSQNTRRVMGGSDYVGSTYGLGKPAYSGVGPRPDWGRSSAD